MIEQTALDSINRKAWGSWGARRWFSSGNDWTDPGEAAAVAWVAGEVRDQPVLDIGVGGGRTVPCLKAISADYTAIDYTPELVEICRRNHPDTRVYQMDARDMSAFEDGSFALAMFSFNGIDAMDYAGRLDILREMSRVLRPGGLALFSTHNMKGPSYRENLWRFVRLPHWSANPLSVCIDAARVVYNLPVATVNYLRYSRLNQEFDGYGVHVCAAHKFGIVIVYTELEKQREALAQLGLQTEVVFGNITGSPLAADADVSDIYWFHVIARKVGTTSAP